MSGEDKVFEYEMNMDEDPIVRKRRKANERQARWRAKQSLEFLKRIRAENTAAKRLRIEQETPEQSQARREADAASHRLRRQAMQTSRKMQNGGEIPEQSQACQEAKSAFHRLHQQAKRESQKMQNGSYLIDEATLKCSSKRDHDQSVVKSSNISATTGGSVVDPSKDSTTRKFTFAERRVVNIGYFVKSLQNLNHHSNLNCNLSDMVITTETRNGWNVGIVLRCEVCCIETKVWLEDPDLKVVPITDNGVMTIGCSQLVSILQKSTVNIAKEKSNTAAVQKRSLREPATTVGSKTSFSLPKFPFQPGGKTRSHTANSSSHFVDTNNGSPPAPVIKQEPISSCEEFMTPLSKNTQSSSGGPTLVQLTFCVDNLDNSSKVDSIGGISFKPSSQDKGVSLTDQSESITVTPDICQNVLKATAISLAGLSESISIAPDINTHESVVLPVDLNLVKKEIMDCGTSESVVKTFNLVSDNVCKLPVVSITDQDKTSNISTESLVRTLVVPTDDCSRNFTVLTEFCSRNSIGNLPNSTTLTENLPEHPGTPIPYQSKSNPILVEDLWSL